MFASSNLAPSALLRLNFGSRSEHAAQTCAAPVLFPHTTPRDLRVGPQLAATVVKQGLRSRAFLKSTTPFSLTDCFSKPKRNGTVAFDGAPK